MLGNFSFGDYFKREACQWAWELAIGEFGLNPERVWVSVFREDDEAFAIWRDVVGVPEARIVRMGEKDNFGPPVPRGRADRVRNCITISIPSVGWMGSIWTMILDLLNFTISSSWSSIATPRGRDAVEE